MPIVSCVSSFSLTSFQRISLAFEQAYETVNMLYKHYSFLQSPLMKGQFQSLYNTCAEYAIHDMVAHGRFPAQVKAMIKSNTAKNHNYLKLETSGCALTFNSCNSLKPENLPRPSIFRQQQSFENQSSFFENWDKHSMVTSYGIILHKKNGYNGSAYPTVALGIPDSEYRKWLDYRTLHQILSSTPQIEVVKEDNEYLDYLRREISKKAEADIESLG